MDSDWAGDPDSRRSTSGVATYLLGVNLQSHSRTQQTIALSSGEAELYAIGAGATDSLFIRSLLLEACLIPRVHLLVHTDSTAGKSKASSYGTSRKTRRVQLRHLFVQELVTSGMITIRKVLGTLNNADILTKYVNKETLARHVATFGLRPGGTSSNPTRARFTLSAFKPELVFAVTLKKPVFDAKRFVGIFRR